jgi:hypothetical protein
MPLSPEYTISIEGKFIKYKFDLTYLIYFSCLGIRDMLILSHLNHVKNVKEALQTRTHRTTKQHEEQNQLKGNSSLGSRSSSSYIGSDGSVQKEDLINDSSGTIPSDRDLHWEEYNWSHILKDNFTTQ